MATARIAVRASAPAAELQAGAAALARVLGLPLAEHAAGRMELVLVLSPEGLELREHGTPHPARLRAEFVRGSLGHRRATLRSTRQLIARAVGCGSRPPAVCDATAGLARDAFVLALLGCRVTAIERCAVLVRLVEDGLRRAAGVPELAAGACRRLRLLAGDSRRLLPRIAVESPPDVVYLDPMFPPDRGRALAGKHMRLCRAVAGPAADEAGLFQAARAAARRRVVVKRPLRAAPLAGEPAFGYRGRTVRYDVYLP